MCASRNARCELVRAGGDVVYGIAIKSVVWTDARVVNGGKICGRAKELLTGETVLIERE
jgi:hypothetical protein